ncbi:LuxR C-terminal-related transcriptional regulator [Streptomyces sp. NBC_01381]|nr:LuxR C-terminal-related transcriptional regulator [Streptomyces sp. NBC_01381]
MTAHSSTALKRRLTPHQLRVLRLIAAGGSRPAVAGALGITLDTVSTHLLRTSQRLQVTGQPGLVHQAYIGGELDRPHRAHCAVEFDDLDLRLWHLIASGATHGQIGGTFRAARSTAGVWIRRLRRRAGAATDAHLVTLGWGYGLLGVEVRRSERIVSAGWQATHPHDNTMSTQVITHGAVRWVSERKEAA